MAIAFVPSAHGPQACPMQFSDGQVIEESSSAKAEPIGGGEKAAQEKAKAASPAATAA